jgi:DEAD/DEAH box helicase domain-containing protein
VTLPQWMTSDGRLRHAHHRPAAPGTTAEFPDWVSAPIREAFARLGVERPWQHQAVAAEHAFAGRHVALSTPTASSTVSSAVRWPGTV